jgi:hypothetical protein
MDDVRNERRARMHRVVMPATTEDASAPRLQISVHVQTDVVAPEIARRRASVWLLENVGNLLRAEVPELVLGERLIWRVDVALTNPEVGQVGPVGRIELDAVTGDLLTATDAAEELITNTYALTED